MGRILLDKSVIHNMLTYIFHVYLWPKYLLKDSGQWMKNFIWSGDVKLRKTTTVAWKAPPSPWIKINTYEAAKGNPGRACCDAIIAVEKTISVNWLWIWLETDSKLLREGNVCASKLASFAAYNLGYRWWDSPPIFISQKLLWC
ncbi:hypothetical protein D0Y65_044134 [Glycine soja]|uniref:RNase H type-1 domain-containing protein n=1 Tax=Glycine soja TaxID=3848 RepID=A0A445GKD6_GLYSO|nr:hypothetical protein D0Y65_044134 [Glycine soja]